MIIDFDEMERLTVADAEEARLAGLDNVEAHQRRAEFFQDKAKRRWPKVVLSSLWWSRFKA